jgi:hypothetical protein
MAWMLAGKWDRKFLLVMLGLNIIWFTAPQDVLYYFVWVGLYDSHTPYFNYLPPEGFWNLWKMLLLRVPMGVGMGVLLIRAGLRQKRGILTPVLVSLAMLCIVAYAILFLFLLIPTLRG